ncbi:MAG: ABC transporter ATP-binding protein [Promethearchaeota archaeon]
MQQSIQKKQSFANRAEFTSGNDPFYSARKKGHITWIIKHIFFDHNKIYALFWLVLVIISAIIYSSLKIVIGNVIDSFGNSNTNIFHAALLILIYAGSYPLIDLGANFLRETLAQRLERDTRHEFYLNLLGKSQSFHDEQRIGDLMARATNDVRQLNYMISPAFSLIFEAFINSIMPIIYIAILYPPQLLITPITFTILFVITLSIYMKFLTPVSRKIQEEYGNLNAVLNESMAGIEVVKGMAMEKQSNLRYRKIAKNYMKSCIKEGKIQAHYLPRLFVAVAITAGLGQSIILYLNNSISVGDIIAYVGLLTTLYFPTDISIWAFSIVRRAEAGARRLLEIMNKSTEIGESKTPIQHEIKGKIQFNNVSFKYPGSDKYALKNITFTANPGETIAIVGTTGSGKSTLTKLISRLYDVNEGEINIDKINIKNFSLNSLRDQIAYIEQDLFLFSYAVSENISFGKVSDQEKIIQAAKDAQAHDFIMTLPKQYETNVGERGVQLSGGERQRIAIARAFLSDPKILVLDDSTSAIDSATEDKIQRAISRVLEGRTTFLITHRLSQIRWADKILVIKRGQLIAQGNHYDLLRESEEYRKIFLTRFDKSLDELLEVDA